MRLLLDTRVLLWALEGNPRLGRIGRDWIEDPANEVWFSAASIWEITIKASQTRDRFGVDAAEIARAALSAGFDELAVTARDASLVADLPMHHRDPFDRLLVAQAMSGSMQLLTADGLFPSYGHVVTLLPA